MNDLQASFATGLCLVGLAAGGVIFLLAGVVLQLFTQVGRLEREVESIKVEQAAAHGCAGWAATLLSIGAVVLLLLCFLLQSVAQAAR